MKVVALAGGTGSAKLLRGLSRIGVDLSVVCNVGDNFEVFGLYVCPDVDIAMYTLAGEADEVKGWGLKGDTFDVLEELGRLGGETWFRLGDRDMALSILRTKALRSGRTLTEFTRWARKSLGIRHPILPVTDYDVQTQVLTTRGRMHLQEFWVRDKGRPGVVGVSYSGSDKSALTEEVSEAIADADRVVLCPANPVTSIGPILAVPGVLDALRSTHAKVTALSPMAGTAPFSGPAGKLLKALRVRPDSVGVAGGYSSFLDEILIDSQDSGMKRHVEKMGVGCRVIDARIRSLADSKRIAKELVRV